MISHPTKSSPGLPAPALLLYSFALAMSILSACSSHRDTGTGPGATYDPMGEHSAETMGLAAIGLVNDLILLLPDWTEGRLGGIGGTRPPESVLSSTDPTWSDADKAWVFSDSLVRGAYPSVSTYRYEYLVRYSACYEWQREARAADGALLDIELVEKGHSTSAPSEPGSYTIDYEYRYWIRGDASDLWEGRTHYKGKGGLQGRHDLVSSSGVTHSSYIADYDIDISLVAGSCPGGTVQIDLAPFLMTVTYNGTASARWVLKRGIQVVKEGRTSIACEG